MEDYGQIEEEIMINLDILTKMLNVPDETLAKNIEFFREEAHKREVGEDNKETECNLHCFYRHYPHAIKHLIQIEESPKP